MNKLKLYFKKFGKLLICVLIVSVLSFNICLPASAYSNTIEYTAAEFYRYSYKDYGWLFVNEIWANGSSHQIWSHEMTLDKQNNTYSYSQIDSDEEIPPVTANAIRCDYWCQFDIAQIYVPSGYSFNLSIPLTYFEWNGLGQIYYIRVRMMDINSGLTVTQRFDGGGSSPLRLRLNLNWTNDTGSAQTFNRVRYEIGLNTNHFTSTDVFSIQVGDVSGLVGNGSSIAKYENPDDSELGTAVTEYIDTEKQLENSIEENITEVEDLFTTRLNEVLAALTDIPIGLTAVASIFDNFANIYFVSNILRFSLILGIFGFLLGMTVLIGNRLRKGRS